MSDPDKTPGQQALNVMSTLQNDAIFKHPSGTRARKKRKEKILDEETYVEEIGKIIQRDFFPDLEKLKAQNEYLDAVDRNDAVRMRQLQMQYSGSRPPTQRIPSPATFETPANIHNEPESLRTVDLDANSDPKDKRLSLDQFLNSHTSQDNQSFTEILDEAEKKHVEKHAYLYFSESDSLNKQTEQLALPSIEKQAAITSKPFNIDTWTYKNKNYIMFNPDGIELTQEQQMEMAKKRQEVVHNNTRLNINPFNESQSKQTINSLAKTQAKINDGKIGVDGKELVKESPKVAGFGFVQAPSPSPSVLATPLMTWGEIEGTPFRLDGGDTPLPKSQGPAFKMSEPPRREQLAIALAEKVGEKKRDSRQKAMDAARRRFATPSPRVGTHSERLAAMSPAARRLATNKLKVLDFRETPKTPNRAQTPKLGIRRGNLEGGTTLTDDLLKIDVPKRNKAEDFF